MRYRADMTSGMAAGLSKSGRMTLRHRTHASTTIAAEKWSRLPIFSSKSLSGEKGEGLIRTPRVLLGCMKLLTHHPTSLRVAMMMVSTSSMATCSRTHSKGTSSAKSGVQR